MPTEEEALAALDAAETDTEAIAVEMEMVEETDKEEPDDDLS